MSVSRIAEHNLFDRVDPIEHASLHTHAHETYSAHCAEQQILP